MAKKRSKPKESKTDIKENASKFKIIGVIMVYPNAVGDAPASVEKLFQRRCKTREELFVFLHDYVVKHGYLGLGKGSQFAGYLEVIFIDIDGGKCSVDVRFGAQWGLRREYPDDTYAVTEQRVRYPDDPELLEWHGSDNPPDPRSYDPSLRPGNRSRGSREQSRTLHILAA